MIIISQFFRMMMEMKTSNLPVSTFHRRRLDPTLPTVDILATLPDTLEELIASRPWVERGAVTAWQEVIMYPWKNQVGEMFLVFSKCTLQYMLRSVYIRLVCFLIKMPPHPLQRGLFWYELFACKLFYDCSQPLDNLAMFYILIFCFSL